MSTYAVTYNNYINLYEQTLSSVLSYICKYVDNEDIKLFPNLKARMDGEVMAVSKNTVFWWADKKA